MQRHNWVWQLGNTLEHLHSIKGYFPSTYSVPGTALDSEDMKINLQKQFLHLEASWSRARKPPVIWHQPYVYTFPSKYLFSCVPPILIHCIFILSHSKYFLCDFFFDIHIFIVAFTHLFSAQPTLTEYLLCTRQWPRDSFWPQAVRSTKRHPPSSWGRQTGTRLFYIEYKKPLFQISQPQFLWLPSYFSLLDCCLWSKACPSHPCIPST